MDGFFLVHLVQVFLQDIRVLTKALSWAISRILYQFRVSWIKRRNFHSIGHANAKIRGIQCFFQRTSLLNISSCLNLKMSGSLYFLFSLFGIFFITACGSTSQYPAVLPTSFASPHPTISHDAQSTVSAGEALSRNLDLTATALGLEQAQINMALTQAAYTQQSQINQTATAQGHTTTALANLQATAAVEQTATFRASASATAWPQTATPLAATQIAIVSEAEKTERRSYWSRFVIPFWVFIGAAILLLVIIGLIYAYRRLIPVLELRLRTFVSPDGDTITYLPANQKIKALLPERSFGPALHSDADKTHTSGIAPDTALQERVTAQNQAARLLKSLPTKISRKEARKYVNASESLESTPIFRILSPNENPPLLDGETLEILEGEWRKVNDETS